MANAAPPPPVLDAMLGNLTKRTQRIDIYESNGTTPYFLDAPLVDGSVTVDDTRPERRAIDVTFHGGDVRLKHWPGGLWYDKVIKPYLGAYGTDGSHWETQVGEFMIDQVQTDRFPPSVKVTGRDYTKKLDQSTFVAATNFQAGNTLNALITALAANCGIKKMILPSASVTLAEDFLFEQDTSRLDAMNKLSQAYNNETFFDANGYLVMRTYRDPAKMSPIFTFRSGKGGSLSDWSKISNDTQIKNVIHVYGETTNSIPLFAEAKNENPSSPTSVQKIGQRTYSINNNFLSTTAACQDLANSQLKLYGLESFEADWTSLVLPWLDVTEVVSWPDPDPAPGDPTVYLLGSFSLPLKLGSMNPVGKRITAVG